jgi:hypothetical protein
VEKTETKKIPQLVFIKGICDFCRKQEDIIEIKIFDEKRKICTDCLVNFDMSLKKKLKRRMYGNLQEFFKSIPQQQEQVALNLSDFTNIMGHDLPKTAYKDRPWWANTDSSPQGKSWQSAGWKLDSIYLHGKVAVFRRKAEDPLTSIPRYIKAILDGGSHIMPPPAHKLTSWIRFCRKVGWYFEGKVLYEKGGLSMDSLSEGEHTEVDEDYAVCKRELMRYKNKKNA